MLILQIVFLLSVCGCPQALRLPISDILKIKQLSKNVTIDMFKTFKLLDQDVGLSGKVKAQSVLFKEFKVIKHNIGMHTTLLQGIGSSVLDFLAFYTDIPPQLKLKLDEINEDIDLIYYAYEDMRAFIQYKPIHENRTLEEFAWSLVSHSNSSVQSVLDRVHAFIEGSSVFNILIQNMKIHGSTIFCIIRTSTQQLVLYLYNTLAMAELKGFLLIEFSYMLLKLDNQGNFTNEIVAAHEWYKKRSAITLKLAVEAVWSAPQEFWKCDPEKHVQNETYIEVTEFLQGYIENEENINTRSCMFILSPSYKYKSLKCDSYGGKVPFCNKNRQCKGELINCNPTKGATVCFAEAGTNRRYEYLDWTATRMSQNRWKDCANNTATFDWWWYWLYNCDYFMCICNEKGVHSDRYFSLLLVTSDTSDNMVVTGLRFVKKNRIIHVQIQQGKLLPMGKIDKTTVRWKPIADWGINSTGALDGVHYHALTWEKRGVYLDDMEVLLDEEVVTGVRLWLVGSYLQLKVRTTHFNFATGKLGSRNLHWAKPKLDGGRKKVNLDYKDVPIRDLDGSRLFSKPNMYLEFTHSDMYMDVAQTTIPFLDAQPVTMSEPVALSGAGLMYKGSEKFGGFITLKIITYDYWNVFRNAYDDNNSTYL